MAKIQAIFIVVSLIYNCFANPSVDVPSSYGGESSLSELKSHLSCLAHQIVLPGARYIKAVDILGEVKKTIKKKKKKGADDKVIPTIAIIGNVDTVLRGAMGHQREWDVNKIGIAGIGAATLNNWSAVGEAVFINGLAIIRPSDNGTADYYHTKTSDKFRTQFSAFFTHGAKKDGDFIVHYPLDEESIKVPLLNFPLNGSMFISEFYSRLYTAVGKHPYCYAGLAQFANLEAIALSMAPVYNEPLFGENKKKYYARPVEKLAGSFALIVGCAANYLDLEDNPKLEAMMKMLLYKNPFDTGRPQAEFHGHAVTLKRCVSSIAEIEADDIGEAFHMVNTARIKTANVQVYVLKSAEQMMSINETTVKGSKFDKKFDGKFPGKGDSSPGLGKPGGDKDGKDGFGRGFGGRKSGKGTKRPGKSGLGHGFGGKDKGDDDEDDDASKDKDGDEKEGKNKEGEQDEKDKKKKEDEEKKKKEKDDEDEEEKRSTLGQLIWHITHLNFTGLF